MKSLADALGISDETQPDATPEAYVEPRTAKEFALSILNSEEYRKSLRQRVTLGILPPAVESWLLNTGWGKPVERVEVDNKRIDLENATLDELRQRNSILDNYIESIVTARQRSATLRMNDAVPQSPSKDSDPGPTSVH